MLGSMKTHHAKLQSPNKTHTQNFSGKSLKFVAMPKSPNHSFKNTHYHKRKEFIVQCSAMLVQSSAQGLCAGLGHGGLTFSSTYFSWKLVWKCYRYSSIWSQSSSGGEGPDTERIGRPKCLTVSTLPLMLSSDLASSLMVSSLGCLFLHSRSDESPKAVKGMLSADLKKYFQVNKHATKTSLSKYIQNT